MMTIQPYSPAFAPAWEEVVNHAINGTLMHSRSYLEYHRNRFLDASLLVYLDGSPVGVFPAHRIEDEVYSHQGLTYGGLVIHQDLKTERIIIALKEILRHYHSLQVTKVFIKEIPSFYGTSSLEWMPYCMFLLEAKRYRSDLS